MEAIIANSAIFEGQRCWRTKITTDILRTHHFLIVFKEGAGFVLPYGKLGFFHA